MLEVWIGVSLLDLISFDPGLAGHIIHLLRQRSHPCVWRCLGLVILWLDSMKSLKRVRNPISGCGQWTKEPSSFFLSFLLLWCIWWLLHVCSKWVSIWWNPRSIVLCLQCQRLWLRQLWKLAPADPLIGFESKKKGLRYGPVTQYTGTANLGPFPGRCWGLFSPP